MNNDDLFEKIKHVLMSQSFGVLATQTEEYPYCTLVSYVNTDDCKNIIFATTRDTRKYRNLKKRPNVSILIDTRTNKVNDFKDARALTILGQAGEVDDKLKSKFLDEFLRKHPYLGDFAGLPSCALIVIKVHKYILVEHFQNVMEYNIV